MTHAQHADPRHLGVLQNGHITTQLIAAAVRLGIHDRLGDDLVADRRLSELTGIELPLLRRFLPALVGLDLVEEAEPHRYRNTALGALLRRDTGSAYGHGLMAGGVYYEAWAGLDYSLRTGKSAFEHRLGESLWDRFASDEEVGAAYARTTRWNTQREMDEILAHYAFPETGVIADLGAGDGSLTAALLERHPGLRAIVMEQPAVIDHTRESLTERGFADRCEFVGGDIGAGVPAGADLYLMKSVLHHFTDDEVVNALRVCGAELTGRAKALVLERTFDTSDMLRSAIRDLTMLVLLGSRDREPEAYTELVEKAGLKVLVNEVGPNGLVVLEVGP
ncbi:hypothetical protein IAG44_40650 [Streptomyces roseirectus]|uniref:Uncharacterized protein n=1 Tax=Streptomyces roseirectus TaxID=2768066 RepID=A0A7H0IQN7_9ACTN|nr:methyltransferase [Streptomyces roseirectus]QNP75103.1 hypothetical protein IAG44_40650 [Streptomyces roseirectus]